MQTSHALPGLAWGLPFVGLLLSIAVVPMVAPRFWQRRMGWVALAWSAVSLVQQAAAAGIGEAAAAAWHAIVIEYAPFATMLLALYATGGGVLLRGGLRGTPMGNTVRLALGMVMGALMGTTAASMVLIHPLMQANAHRQRKTHLVLFLIILVGNASITPLGNPPLYIGLLHGVPFLWPIRHLAFPLLVVTLLLLSAFYALDRVLAAKEPPAPPPERFRIRGWWNVGLIVVVIVLIMLQGRVQLGDVVFLGQTVRLSLLAGIAILVLATLLSVWITPRAIRQANDFNWHPMAEVAMLFAGIFVTIGPVVDMLRAGLDGPLAPLLHLTRDHAGTPLPVAYFWLTEILSAFLDNAPTYLVFFELAGINPADLGGHQGVLLAAISAGAVFFGGLTYIGNAPNMMLRAIASHRGVRMPGFFGFMILSSCLLLPVLAVVSLFFI